MRKALITCFSIFLLAAVAAADDPWLDKSYRNWDQKDVHKILNDSPWAQTVQASTPWLRRRADAASDASQPYGLPPGAAIGNAAFASFLVRWGSAKTVRAAEAREAVLRGRMQPGDAEESLKEQPSEYELVLVINPSVGLLEHNEYKLQESAHLRGKRMKSDVLASRAQIEESADGKNIAVHFYFPKQDSAGNPSLSPDETGIEFECSMSGANIRAVFQPQKMRTEAGPDL